MDGIIIIFIIIILLSALAIFCGWMESKTFKEQEKVLDNINKYWRNFWR